MIQVEAYKQMWRVAGIARFNLSMIQVEVYERSQVLMHDGCFNLSMIQVEVLMILMQEKHRMKFQSQHDSSRRFILD